MSTHISRAVTLLKQKGKDISVISTNKIPSKVDNVQYIQPMLLWILVFKKKSIVHFHVDSLPHLILAYILSPFHKTYLTVHNNRYPSDFSKSTFRIKLKRILLKSFHKIISVNSESTAFLQLHFQNIHPETIPAFLPPQTIDRNSLLEIKQFTKDFKHVLSGYVYRLSFFNGQDLYGLDMMVDLTERLVKKELDICLVLLINLDESEYLDEIRKRVKEKNIFDRILFVDTKNGVDAVALWEHSDVYLRPTNTDGNSISILEALYVKTKVVASDCVERPEGCYTFHSRDVSDFERATIQSLEDTSTSETITFKLIEYE